MLNKTIKRIGRGRRHQAWGALALAVLFCGFGMLSIQADTRPLGSFVSRINKAGVPGGWINLPMVTGTLPIPAETGKGLFEELKKLGGTLGAQLNKRLTLVVEGEDSNLVPSQVVAGSPEVIIVSQGSSDWQTLVSGAFAIKLDPTVVRIGHNRLGFSLPNAFMGGLIQVSGEGIETAYAMVDDPVIGFSWEGMGCLGELGVFELEVEILSAQDGASIQFLVSLDPHSGSLEISTIR